MVDLPKLIKLASAQYSFISIVGITSNAAGEQIIVLEYRGYTLLVPLKIKSRDEEKIIAYIIEQLRNYKTHVDQLIAQGG
jgi:hypothetical protein